MALTVGLVGFGEIAQYHLRFLAAAGAHVVAVVTSRPVPAGLQKYPSAAAMLPHVDAITVAVPNFLHASLCLQAVAAGRPVFVEKPLCLRAEELAELERCLPAAGLPIHVGFRLRWNPRLRALRERLRGVRQIRCVYRLGLGHLAAGKKWTRRQAESGGAFFTLGVHALDLARWLARSEGARLQVAEATADHPGASADFPLVAFVRGMLPNGIEIVAGADLRGDARFTLELALDEEERWRSDELPAPGPDDPGAGQIEYAAMMAAFVRAAEARACDTTQLLDVLECHRALIDAQQVASSHSET